MLACNHEAVIIELEVDDLNACVAGGTMYTKDKLPGQMPQKRQTSTSFPARRNFDDTMARKVSEVLRSQARRAAHENFNEQTIRGRIVPMSWSLTWKALMEPADPKDRPVCKGGCRRPRPGSSFLYPRLRWSATSYRNFLLMGVGCVCRRKEALNLKWQGCQVCNQGKPSRWSAPSTSPTPRGQDWSLQDYESSRVFLMET